MMSPLRKAALESILTNLLINALQAMPEYGGEIILAEAREVLWVDFPELADRVDLRMPGEKDKRHGQAIAAASLPAREEPGGVQPLVP